jgi:hypothetical protein
MPYAPRPDPTRMYFSQPGTAIAVIRKRVLHNATISRFLGGIRWEAVVYVESVW